MSSLSSSERAAHVAAWRASGLSQAAYCRQSGLACHRLRDWVRTSRRGGNGGAPAGFIEVNLAATPSSSAVSFLMPNGVRVEVVPGTDPRWLAQVVQALVLPC